MEDNSHLVPSAYNVAQLSRGGRQYVLFNAASTALLTVDASDFEAVEELFPTPLLEGGPVRTPFETRGNGRLAVSAEIPGRIARPLREGGFIVPRDLNERDFIRTRYNIARMRAPLRFVVAPTLDCNFNCFYCFEAKSKEKMSSEVQDSLASFVASRLKVSSSRNLTVEWYGGEPLLALDVVRNLSFRFRNLCQTSGTVYNAALVTNGLLLDRATVGALSDCGIRSYHVTLDGTAEVHDGRRVPAADAAPTFDAIVANIEAASESAQVNVRLNVGRSNRDAVGSFLGFTRERGWDRKGIEVYPAPIFGSSSPCMGYPDEALPEEEFDSVLDEFCSVESAPSPAMPDSADLAEILGFPPGRHYTCEALAYNSYAVSPSGSLFKCPLEIDDDQKAVGHVSRPLDLCNVSLLRWLSFDPFSVSECKDCLFVPLCLGGCPKKLFEEGDAGRRSACRFWSKRFSALLSLAARRHLHPAAAR
jgi:uncharacterized protein